MTEQEVTLPPVCARLATRTCRDWIVNLCEHDRNGHPLECREQRQTICCNEIRRSIWNMTTARPHPIFSGIRMGGPVLVLAGLTGELTVAQSSAKALSPCPAVEKPVCARLAGRLKSYGNACEAENAGATVIARGLCPKSKGVNQGGR